MLPARPSQFIDTEEGFCRLLERLQGVRALALDTESNSFHAYFEKVCLIQLSTAEEDFAVDPLRVDVRPLGAWLADKEVELVLHAADFDVRGLKRDYGFQFAGLFDTMLAAKLLGYPGVGLAALVEGHFGIALAKEHQRSDWGRRPLSGSQLEYAYCDTRYLLPLRAMLCAELERTGKRSAAEALFVRQAACVPRKKQFDLEGFKRIRGFPALGPLERQAVRALYLVRDECARSSNRPSFKVLGDEALIELARRMPRTESELLEVRGVGENTVRRHGKAILAALGQMVGKQEAA